MNLFSGHILNKRSATTAPDSKDVKVRHPVYAKRNIFGLGIIIFMAGCVTTNTPLHARPVSLSWFAKRYGFTHFSQANKEHLANRTHSMIFEAKSRKFMFDGTSIWLNDPLSKHWGRQCLSQRDIDKTIMPLINPRESIGRRGHKIVVLDPGHGGSDFGAIGRRNVQEKLVVLDIARRARAILQANGIEVKMTRTEDKALSLSQRMELTTKWKPDAFVSIHINAAQASSASGVETHITPPRGCPITAKASTSSRDEILNPNNYYDEANMLLGYHLQHNMVKHLKRDDRGLRRSRFFVTRNATCPAALVECGFVSNRREEELFLQATFRQAAAQAIADGITSYFNEIK